jgi:ketosteroid isomerase-like protein
MPAGNVKRGVFVFLLLLFTGARFFGSAQTKKGPDMATQDILQQAQGYRAQSDEAAIRALEDRFTAAFNAGDIDAIMKNYVQGNSLVVFDVVPRKQNRGAGNYRQNWADFFTHFKGTPKITITDLGITLDGNVGFSHSIQHIVGTDVQGHPVNRTVRVTDGYRKIGGSWLIALEHISVPVDLTTGKPASPTKP